MNYIFVHHLIILSYKIIVFFLLPLYVLCNIHLRYSTYRYITYNTEFIFHFKINK